MKPAICGIVGKLAASALIGVDGSGSLPLFGMDWAPSTVIGISVAGATVAAAATVAPATEIPITVEGAQSMPNNGSDPDPSTPISIDAASLPTIPQMAGFITYFMTVLLFDMLLYIIRAKNQRCY